MVTQAERVDKRSWTSARVLRMEPWLPADSPVASPRQSVAADDIDDVPLATSPRPIAARRTAMFGGTVFLTALLAIGPYLLHARRGFSPLEGFGFAIFLILAASIACWFCNAVAGQWVLLSGREQDDLDFREDPAAPTTRTALLMPLYNEDAEAACARLEAMDASLAQQGRSGAFDIFVLSDSTSEQVAQAERAALRALRLRAQSRVYLRRRQENTERKAGNVFDWVMRFGAAYDFMIVLDADSRMDGGTVLRLVDAMERHPGVGIIQTTPIVTGATTLFARLSQFGVRLYGRVAGAGVAWWAGSEASYWGHNAIIRTRAFAASARLPILEGVKPFGGHILSHDVVEAAMMRRAGWAVHVTAALGGSFEETPPTLIDFMQRDRRWCQGNLQHLRMMTARGLHPINRLQLGMGVMAYASSPLWFLGLVTGLGLQLAQPVDWPSFWYFLNPRLSPFLLTGLLSAVLLMGPKLLGMVVAMASRKERAAFGGGRALLKSVGLEIALSIALAPVLMVASTKSVVMTLLGRDSGWRPQQRDREGLSWPDGLRAMAWQMATGAGFVVALCFRPDLCVCFAPIVLPLLLSAPLAVLTSSRALGEAAARAGLLLTPEEHAVSRGRTRKNREAVAAFSPPPLTAIG